MSGATAPSDRAFRTPGVCRFADETSQIQKGKIIFRIGGAAMIDQAGDRLLNSAAAMMGGQQGPP
jgi:hypothetical protein